MKLTLVIAAVLVTFVASAKVPQMSEVSVDVDEMPVVAHVVEVSKDHVHKPDLDHIQVVAKVPEPLVNKVDVVVDDVDKVVTTPVAVEAPVMNAVHSVVGTTVSNVPQVTTVLEVLPVVPESVVSTTAVPLPVVPVIKKANIMAEDPCDLLCTKFELNPVCASNGICLHEFANQCIMDTFNCKHPKMSFKATKDDRCLMHWLQRCTEQDLMG